MRKSVLAGKCDAGRLYGSTEVNKNDEIKKQKQSASLLRDARSAKAEDDLEIETV
jgi:hypothetical protein